MPAEPAVVTLATLRDWPLPSVGANKDSRGRLLVVGGSAESPGAVRLAGEAALRAGAGKVRIATVESVTAALGVAFPESGMVGLPETEGGHLDPSAVARLVEEAEDVDAVLVGPGMTGKDDVVRLVEGLVTGTDKPVVIDALASSYLTEHPQGAEHLGGSVVLTVNTSELAHTDGCEEDEAEKDAATVSARVAARSRVVVLHGGEQKHIVAPDGSMWSVSGGGPGLGVSGSGDVQAGLVAGLLARGAEPAQAAAWGAFLHIQAGERLIERVGQVGFLASELAPEVPSLLDLTR